MDEKLKIALQDYVATVNSGKYGDDYTTLISKFPELTGFEKQSLDDYVATSNSGKYGDDWDLLNSKFPEFTSPKQNEVSGAGSKNTSETSAEPSKTSQKPSWIHESGDVIQDTKGTTKFDLGLNRVEVENLQFEEPLIDEKTGRPLEVTYQAELTPEQDTGERSYLQNLENSLNNNLNQLKGFDERVVVTAGALSKKLLPIVGSSAEELYQYAGLDFNTVMETAINELDRLAGETLETANFTDADNAKDFFSALTDSVLAVVNSGLVASTTYGVGLFTDMVGGSISEANSTKADRLGISVEDLYRTNQEDFYAPAILGSAGYLLERYGLKGAKQAINRKISSGLGRYLSTVAIDNNKEGVTEWLQYGGDSVNTFLAEGGRVEDAGEIFADALFSKQGLEMYLKGMAGSTAISAPSVIVNSISNSKTRTQAYKLDTERRKLIQELQNEFIVQNPITRDAVLTKIESISDELNALYSQDLSENKGNLTVEQTEEVNTLSSQITEIEQSLENPEMSEEVKTALNEEKNTLQTKIDEVISNASVQQNEMFTETEQSEIVNNEETVVNTVINEQNEENNLPDTVDNELQQSPDVLEIEGEVKTPTSEKLQEIQTKREKIRERIRKRGGTLSAGINPEDMVDYIALGATYVEEGIVKFSEFVSNLKSDLPEKQFKKLNDKNLREIYTKSAEAQGYKIRQFSESVRTSKKVSDETKAIVQDNPETIAYEPQVLATATERVEALPELERLNKVATLSKATTSLSESDNDAILAGISLINKYESEGRHEESAKIIQQMAKSATVMGQALRQYGEFKNSTPAGYMSLVEEALKEKGKELNATNRGKIEQLYKELQGAVETYQQAVELTGKDTSKKAWSDRKKAQIALEDANRKLSDYVAKVYGKSWGRVMSTILQGSLLTPKSLIINPFSNIVQGAIRAGINTNAFIFDTIISNIWGLPKSKIGINTTSLRLGAKAVKEGTQTATRKAVKGDASLETNKFEMSTRLKPWESAKDLWYSITEKEFREEFDQDFEDQFSNAIEATIGIVPNLMFRMLPFGDDPFFASVRTLRLVEIGKTNKGLKGEELEQFVNNPDEDSDMIATSYAKEATFQDPTKLAKAIQSIMRTVEDLVGNSQLGKSRFIKGLTQVMLKQAVPFVNTPSSIIWKTVSFSVPPIPFLMAVNQFIKLYNIKGWESSPKKREEVINAKRKLVEYLGEATLASSLLYVSSLLVSMGLATGDLPDESERAKEKNFMYNTQPANTLNISGLRRLLAGEDSTWQQGDYVVSYIPLGVLGAQIGITEATLGKQLREAVKKSKTISPDGVPQEVLSKTNIAQQVTGNWLGNLPAALTYVIGQPFVQSTEVMLSSLSKGDTGQWGIQMVRTLSNLGVPNAVSQAFRASNEYMRDIYTENDLETFGNIIKEKTANVEDLPMRYNMWGEPVKQSPEGTNPYVFQMLDIFRTQKILEDEVTYKVFDIYRKTKENSVIPNTVKDYYKDKDFTVKLTKQQKADLSRIVGEERRKRVEKVLRNYTKDSDPEKFVKQLSNAYSKGASQGKRILLKQMKEQGIDVKANIRAFRESVEDED